MSDEKSNGHDTAVEPLIIDETSLRAGEAAEREAEEDLKPAHPDPLAATRLELGGQQVAAAALAGAARGIRFTLASLHSASPELLHAAVRASLPAPWRITVPDLSYFSQDQWRLILAWRSLWMQLGHEVGIEYAVKLYEEEAAKRPPPPAAAQTPDSNP